MRTAQAACRKPKPITCPYCDAERQTWGGMQYHIHWSHPKRCGWGCWHARDLRGGRTGLYARTFPESEWRARVDEAL
jgi:hypothetical protein